MYAFVLTIEELRKLLKDCQEQSSRNAPLDVLYANTYRYRFALGRMLSVFGLYNNIGVGLSVARFDNLGNAKAFLSWNEWQRGSALLFMCIQIILLNTSVRDLQTLILLLSMKLEDAKSRLKAETNDALYAMKNPFGNATACRKLIDYLYACVKESVGCEDAKGWLFELYSNQSDEEKKRIPDPCRCDYNSIRKTQK